MMQKRNFWPMLVLANVLVLGMLGLYRSSPAAPAKQQPFVNPAGQREEIIEQLKELNRLVRHQNELLSSGRLKVVVVGQRDT